jgi:hypothetical protein
MLRFKLLVSVLPLLAAAVFARVGLWPSTGPCIAVGDDIVEIATTPFRADLQVSFTDDPARATVRVVVAASAEEADFAIVDDVDTAEEGACGPTPATRFVAVTAWASKTVPVIYLAADGPADYRVFVRSKRYTVRDAAALIVGARGAPAHLAAAL